MRRAVYLIALPALAAAALSLAGCQVSVDNQSKANAENAADSVGAAVGNTADTVGAAVGKAAKVAGNAADAAGNQIGKAGAAIGNEVKRANIHIDLGGNESGNKAAKHK